MLWVVYIYMFRLPVLLTFAPDKSFTHAHGQRNDRRLKSLFWNSKPIGILSTFADVLGIAISLSKGPCVHGNRTTQRHVVPLSDPSELSLDRWLLASREEEPLILQQFLRFGETKTIAQQLLLQESSERSDFL
ncbi:hypothetical protein CEXT_252671 [Caerostris extrusa]|uniref:Uncharacterized protein n=1 Tax=Caerostris extrusa TaxID=172846 RepID=A0AAV4MXT8_CAEEX|nr:hypothetical protein CEXT_252671 [Caerostris extrusa]